MSKAKAAYLVALAIISLGFVCHALSVSFTQDDAYISYRYVKNFLAGNGLVYNPGERVEGYTNFFFIILMILFGLLNVNYIVVSKVLGVASGVSIIIIVFFWAKRSFGKEAWLIPALSAPFLLLCNSAFAYWAISGLETVLFAALTLLGLFLASRKHALFVPVMAIAALVRPEGALIFVLVLFYYLLTRGVRPKIIASFLAIFAVLLLPQVIFRVAYYNDILPNPFYAKTGWSLEYLSSGVSYLWLFARQYGFWGILLLFPIIGVRLLPHEFRLPLFITIFYIIYILLVGGDVLHGHRFFIPVLPIMYLLFISALFRLLQKLRPGRKMLLEAVFVILVLAIGAASYFIPREKLTEIREREIALVENMKYQAEVISRAGKNQYSIACSTIGAFGYFSNAVVIDMLGLTDRVIAKNPEPFAGIKSTWKERNYNIPYLMERRPDLILFSTGMKPSAPAEKALFLSSRFRRGYYPIFHETNVLWTVYRRKGELDIIDQYYSDARFINLYVEALQLDRDRKFELAYEYARQSLNSGPPGFYYPLVLMGETELQRGKIDDAVGLFHEAIELSDGYSMRACDMLRRVYERLGDSTKAEFYLDIIREKNRL